ncbi:S1 family peptidase [Nocardia jiangxiensis]|uniref:S1 family peptidase n=1 Tax=Nocardia jiangxiensis TaxID=282685 RepID=A0ABW6SA67_9NOCA
MGQVPFSADIEVASMHFLRNAAMALAIAAAGTAVCATPPASAVVGGTEVSATAYPWLGAIGSPAFPLRPGGQFCAGALIAPDKVLTAAHCVIFAEPVPHALTVTFGRADLTRRDGTSVGVKAIGVDPGFRISTFDGDLSYHHDVAVLTLQTKLTLPTVRVATPRGSTGTVVGWGATSGADDSNVRLRTVTVPLAPAASCTAAYGAEFDSAHDFCAGSTTADTAEFDSGGPLLVDGAVAGVTSWGKGVTQAGFPGIYAGIPSIGR